MKNLYLYVMVFAVDLSLGGRKLLQEWKKEDDIPDHNPKGKNNKKYSGPSKVGIAAAGIFLTCCVFICPCLHRKKRANAHTVLTRDPNSSESYLTLPKLYLVNFGFYQN